MCLVGRVTKLRVNNSLALLHFSEKGFNDPNEDPVQQRACKVRNSVHKDLAVELVDGSRGDGLRYQWHGNAEQYLWLCGPVVE